MIRVDSGTLNYGIRRNQLEGSYESKLTQLLDSIHILDARQVIEQSAIDHLLQLEVLKEEIDGFYIDEKCVSEYEFIDTMRKWWSEFRSEYSMNSEVFWTEYFFDHDPSENLPIRGASWLEANTFCSLKGHVLPSFNQLCHLYSVMYDSKFGFITIGDKYVLSHSIEFTQMHQSLCEWTSTPGTHSTRRNIFYDDVKIFRGIAELYLHESTHFQTFITVPTGEPLRRNFVGFRTALPSSTLALPIDLGICI